MTSKKNVKFSPKVKFINTSYFIKSDFFGYSSPKHKNSNLSGELKDFSDMYITSYALNSFIVLLKFFNANQ